MVLSAGRNSANASLKASLYICNSTGSVGIVVIIPILVSVVTSAVGNNLILGDGDGASDGNE